MRFILASSSPRRIQMLSDLNIAFECQSPSIDEAMNKRESARSYVLRLSKEKAKAVQNKMGLHESSGDWSVLAADTTVVLKNKILGKPESEAEALKMLKALSGTQHQVLTAYTLLGSANGKMKTFSECVATKVQFSKRSESFWRWYVSTGEPMDKAGSYAAQGIGMSFVKSYQGSYANVVGLPLPEIITSYQKTFGKAAFLTVFRHL